MVRCREDHLFCRDCLKRLLETALGDQKAVSRAHDPPTWPDANRNRLQPVHCMDGSGCKALFGEKEIQKVLTPKMANSYFALVQRKELEAAGIENLETCPFCEFAIVIENEQEKLFTCQHPACEVVSCRSCKKPVSEV
jgi:TRIAD3 protein (E3 ubiquitin-protein ligase RNF216)